MTAYEPASPDRRSPMPIASRIHPIGLRGCRYAREHADDAERHEGAERASEVGEVELVCEVRQRNSGIRRSRATVSTEHERRRGRRQARAHHGLERKRPIRHGASVRLRRSGNVTRLRSAIEMICGCLARVDVLRSGVCARSAVRPQPSGRPDPAQVGWVVRVGLGERAPGLRRDAGRILNRQLRACPATQPTPPLAPHTPATQANFDRASYPRRR